MKQLQDMTESEIEQRIRSLYFEIGVIEKSISECKAEIARRHCEKAVASCPFKIGDKVLVHNKWTQAGIYLGPKLYGTPLIAAIKKDGTAHPKNRLDISDASFSFEGKTYEFNGTYKQLKP